MSLRLAVELEHLGVEAADDQQRRSAHPTKSGGGKIGPATARDDGRYLHSEIGGGDQGCGGSRARAEIAER